MDILNVALFIVTDKLHNTWKINPLMKSKRRPLPNLCKHIDDYLK